MNDADARRPVCRLIMYESRGNLPDRGILVTVHLVHIAVHWMVHIPLGRISCMTRTGCLVCPVRRFVMANVGYVCSWRSIPP
jgi:hypothetical protein